MQGGSGGSRKRNGKKKKKEAMALVRTRGIGMAKVRTYWGN